MLSGQINCSVGTGLLIKINATTPIVTLAAFTIIAGFQRGTCANMPNTAVQAKFDEEVCQDPVSTFVDQLKARTMYTLRTVYWPMPNQVSHRRHIADS